MRLSTHETDDAVVNGNNDYFHLHFLREKRIYTVDEVSAQPADGSDDLAKLPELNEESLLRELHRRYRQDRIYVSLFCGK